MDVCAAPPSILPSQLMTLSSYNVIRNRPDRSPLADANTPNSHGLARNKQQISCMAEFTLIDLPVNSGSR